MQAPAASTDEVVFLKGRPPLPEYIGFVTQNDVGGSGLTPPALASEWRDANARIRRLEESERGIADNPEVTALPPALEVPAAELGMNPAVLRSFGFVPFSFGLVDLDKVVVFQKFINTSFAGSLSNVIQELRTDHDLFRFVFPVNGERPQTRMARIGPNVFSFTSPSMDFRALDVPVLAPSQLAQYETGGLVTQVVGVALGYGANLLQVINYKNRLLLGNGSHRAYALAAAGKKKVPCLVQHATLEEELKMLFPNIQASLDSLFVSPRPPMLKDYFDPELVRRVRVAHKVRQIRVMVQVEQTDIPG